MYEGQGQMDPQMQRRMMMAQALMQGQGGGVPQGVPGGAPMMAPGGVPMGVPGGAPMAGMAPAVMPPMMPEQEMGRPRPRGGAGRLFGGAGGFQNRYE